MAKIKIYKKDGTLSPFFWSDREESVKTRKTVYKWTNDGIRRMRGVHFDPTTNRMTEQDRPST